MGHWAPLLFLLPVIAGAQQPSYFPIDLGNEWVYRIDSRIVSAQYQTWRVDRIETRAGVKWSVIQIIGPGTGFAESFFRVDDQGRIYQPKGDSEALFFDPVAFSEQSTLKFMGRGGGYIGPLGSFSDTIAYRNDSNGFHFETGVLVRGVGLVSSTDSILGGSSGGFSEGRTLLEARLAGGVRLGPVPAASTELSLESLTLDVTGKKVTNCALPCYFAACGLVPFYDPPGTYRPCAQARVRVNAWPAASPARIALRLTAPDGETAWQTTLADRVALGAVYVQVPLYAKPNEPFPPGAYRLQLTLDEGAATASLPVEIR
jgi:hypothetical protein